MKQKYFVFLFLNFIWLVPVFSQNTFSNGGKLVIEPGTQISAGDFINNAAGAFTNNGSLFVQGDYKNDGIVNIGTGTTTFNQRDTSPSETIQNVYGTSAFEFYNLVVNNNTSLGVLIDDGIGFTVKNNLHLQEGNLRLEGQSQLVQTKSGADANTAGTGNILIDQQGIASGYGYNYWSSPVNVGNGTYSLDNVLYDGTDSSVNPFSPTAMLFTTAKNGIPTVLVDGDVTTAATVSSQYMYTYVKHDFGAPDWDKIDETTNLDPTNGYIMKGTNTAAANQNYTFKGQPNNGDYSYTISAGESSLLGNPYPSAFNAGPFIRANSVLSSGFVGQIYFWTDGGTTEHFSDAIYGGYAVRNLFTGVPADVVTDEGLGSANITPPGPYVAVGQGFFVKALNSGTITFTNDFRVYYPEDGSGSGSTFYKNTNQKRGIASKDDLSKNQLIRLGYEDPEGFHRQIVLGFLPDGVADMNFNIGYDSPVFGPREDDLFFIIENDPSKQYVIQGVGLFDENDVFPLSLTIAEEGVHTIMLDAVENFEGDVFIYDTVLDVIYNLKEESFSPSIGIGVYNDRFQLVFKPQKTLGVNEPNKRSFNVYFNNENSIVVNNKKNLEIAKISIFNTLGQQLLSLDKEDVQNLETRIPFNKNRGVYLVIVETNNAKETYRIIN